MGIATQGVAGIDWAERWRALVRERESVAKGHSDPRYWDRRAHSFAQSTGARADSFLEVLEPFLSPRKTLIDVGSGAGRHAVPLAGRIEWVTAVEPSEGMRAQMPPLDNMTVIASGWEDAEVAAADLVICCHVLYGVEEPVPFIEKLERCARQRVFIMLREAQIHHPAAVIRERLAGAPLPRMPQFTDLLLLLVQMGVLPDVTFVRYPTLVRYADMNEAMADCQAHIGDRWDEGVARAVLEETLKADGEGFVFDGGDTVSGIGNWQPRRS